MMPDKVNTKPLKPSDFIKNQQKAEEAKLIAKKQLEKNSHANVVKIDSEKPDVDDQDVADFKLETKDFMENLRKVLQESRDRKFVDDKIFELDFYKMLSSKMLSKGCDASSYKTAKNFLQTIDQAQALLENLWKFYANN